MGKCKDCDHWTQDTNKSNELDAVLVDYGQHKEPIGDGYGRCQKAKHGAPMMAKYDGGYTGELLTQGDFGCNQFRAK